MLRAPLYLRRPPLLKTAPKLSTPPWLRITFLAKSSPLAKSSHQVKNSPLVKSRWWRGTQFLTNSKNMARYALGGVPIYIYICIRLQCFTMLNLSECDANCFRISSPPFCFGRRGGATMQCRTFMGVLACISLFMSSMVHPDSNNRRLCKNLNLRHHSYCQLWGLNPRAVACSGS